MKNQMMAKPENKKSPENAKNDEKENKLKTRIC